MHLRRHLPPSPIVTYLSREGRNPFSRPPKGVFFAPKISPYSLHD